MKENEPSLWRTYSGYQVRIYESFGVLGDYLWKSPQFIQTERKIEANKLRHYFPDSGSEEERRLSAEIRGLRSAHENQKLFGDFPILIARSNLFLTIALLEEHLIALAHRTREDSETLLQATRGNGIERCFRYFRNQAILPEKSERFDEVLVAITIRNALLHASGDLHLSRDSQRIRQIVAGSLHVEKARRGSGPGMADDEGRPELAIVGDQLVINHYYPFRVAGHCRTFLLDLSSKIPSALTA